MSYGLRKVGILLLVTVFCFSTLLIGLPVQVEAQGYPVKFIGSVMSASAPTDIVVVVEQVLNDPQGGLVIGSSVWVDAYGYYQTNSRIDWPLGSGDRVEVYGEARIGGFGQARVSGVGVGPLPHYLRKFGATGLPDLAFQKVGFNKPEPFEEGDVVSFGAEIVNQGDADAYTFQVEVYIDGQLNDYGPISLGAGQGGDIWSENPWMATGGTHVLEWRVDTNNAVAEGNEGNNTKSRTFTVEETSKGYTLTIDADGPGTTDPSPGTYSYSEGTQVTITALHAISGQFDGWSGDVGGTSNPVVVTMNRDKVVYAHFSLYAPTRYTLTIRTNGCGDTDPSEGTYTFDEGDRVSISADPCRDWNFDHWGGDASGSSTSITVTMNSNRSVTAYFEEEGEERYTLSTSVSPSGSGSVSPSSGTYDQGERVTLKASTTKSGWKFKKWGGAASGSSSSTSVTMNSDKSVTAYFEEKERIQYKLTVKMHGCGKTAPGEGTHTFDAGERVTATAEACDGWEFENWWGQAVNWKVIPASSVTVFMDENKTLEASFGEKEPEKKEFELTIHSTAGGTTKPKPDTYVHKEGKKVSIDAVADDGWDFKEWGGNASGTSSSTSITMNSNKSVTAHFEEEEGEGLPDLVIESIRCAPGVPIKGEKVSLEIDIRNVGINEAAEFDIDLTYCGNTLDRSISKLNAGRSRSVQYDFQSACSGAARATVDSTNEIEESDEGNNILVTSIEVDTAKGVEERISSIVKISDLEKAAEQRRKVYRDWAKAVWNLTEGEKNIKLPSSGTLGIIDKIAIYAKEANPASTFAGAASGLASGFATGVQHGQMIINLVKSIVDLAEWAINQGKDSGKAVYGHLRNLGLAEYHFYPWWPDIEKSGLCRKEAALWDSKDFGGLIRILGEEEKELSRLIDSINDWGPKESIWSEDPEEKELRVKVRQSLTALAQSDLLYVQELKKLLAGDDFDELDLYFK